MCSHLSVVFSRSRRMAALLSEFALLSEISVKVWSVERVASGSSSGDRGLSWRLPDRD